MNPVTTRRLAGLLAIFACAACSLFVDTGELTSDDGPSPDAGSDASVAADVSVAETSVDAGSDGPPLAAPCPDGGFCDDFERAMTQGKWDSIGQTGASAISIDGTVAKWGTSSLHVVLDATADDKSKSFLTRNFNSKPAKIRVSADVRVATAIVREMHFLTFEVYSPIHRALYFLLSDNGLAVAEQEFGSPGYFGITPSGAIPPGDWHHVMVELTPATKQFRTELDGEQRASGSLAKDFASSPSFDVYVGNVYSIAGDRAEIWFDDLRVEQTF